MTIAAVYRTLWRHRLFIILLTAALAVATYVITSREQKQYTASTLVRIQEKVTQESDLYGSLITGERLARTYALISQTSSVRDLVRKRLPRSVPDDALKIHAEQVSDLEVLKVSVTNPVPAIAARVANAVPGALADFGKESGTPREVISVVERASVPTVPSSPNVKLNVVIAILLGLVLNSGLVLLIEAFSDRVGTIEELERATGQPVIAAIPPLRFSKGVPAVAPEVAEPPFGQPQVRHQSTRVDGAGSVPARSSLPTEHRLGGLGGE